MVQVKQDHIRPIVLDALEGYSAIGRRGDLVALFEQGQRDDLADGLLVFDHQHT